MKEINIGLNGIGTKGSIFIFWEVNMIALGRQRAVKIKSGSFIFTPSRLTRNIKQYNFKRTI